MTNENIEKLPEFLVKRNPKWSVISYDFWKIDYNLKEEACKLLYQILDKILEEKESRIVKFFGFGKTCGFIIVRTDYLPVFESVIREKIFDKNNWEEILVDFKEKGGGD